MHVCSKKKIKIEYTGWSTFYSFFFTRKRQKGLHYALRRCVKILSNRI